MRLLDRTLFAGGITVVLMCSTTPPAYAQAVDLAGAETLFEKARELMAQGRLDEACPKFAESQRLAPAAGTALNLATCYEKQGKTASAWASYREAIGLAVASSQGVREQFARDSAAKLEPKLNKVTIAVGSDEKGLEIRRDGVLVARAQWGTPIPVDPGRHVIEAIAPKKKKWSKSIDVKGEGTAQTLTIPGLEDAPPEEVARTPDQGPKEPVDNGGALRIVGFITMGVGAAAIGAGSYFGLSSSSKQDEIESSIANGQPWSAERQATYDDGESAATLANVLFISGGVALAAGAVLTIIGYSKKNEVVALRRSPFAWTF
jgi:hypothetical protein